MDEKRLTEIEPQRNAVIVQLLDGKWIVSIECKDARYLPELKREAQKLVDFYRGSTHS